jgi:serine/threonine protein kinase
MKTVFQQLGPYTIAEAIGHGMAGSVFLARDSRTQQLIALKLVPHGTDSETLEILEAERWGAELQKQLSRFSRHVPVVHEHGNHEAGYYVAMEYLDGENLATLISRGRIPPDEAAGIAIELCMFLEDAHRFEAVLGDREFRSLVHGDLTPRNVRITSARKVKVLDFGIAKALSLSRKVTRNDFGTLWYLSPERLETGVVDEHADYWALGVMLYEMISGARPFQAEDTRRLERLILSRQSAPPLKADCPAGLGSVIAKLLAPLPADRYASATAIREDLERFRNTEQTLAEQEGWSRNTGEIETRRTQSGHASEEETRRTVNPKGTAPGEAPASSGVEGIPGHRPSGRRRLRWLLAAVLLVAVSGIIFHESRLRSEATRLSENVPMLEMDQLAAIWDRYDGLTEQAYLPFATMGLGRRLTERSSIVADRVIANYRSSLPTVREAQWQSARDALARAVAFDTDDPGLRAALRYCEGHLYRINGEAKRSRRQFAEAQQDLTDAVAAFREAAELRADWPDPFLGLARTFIYGLQDLDRGADALRQAERNGYQRGEREVVQLADGYRVRGDTLVRNARQLDGMPQEREFLERAAEAYRQALSLYLSIRDFSNVSSSIRLAQQALNRIDQRLAELSGAARAVLPAGQTDAPTLNDPVVFAAGTIP